MISDPSILDPNAPQSSNTNHRLCREKKYSIPKASKVLGIGATKLRDMVGNGIIPTVDVEGQNVILECDLEEYLQKKYTRVSEKKPTKYGRSIAQVPAEYKNHEYFKK